MPFRLVPAECGVRRSHTTALRRSCAALFDVCDCCRTAARARSWSHSGPFLAHIKLMGREHGHCMALVMFDCDGGCLCGKTKNGEGHCSFLQFSDIINNERLPTFIRTLRDGVIFVSRSAGEFSIVDPRLKQGTSARK